MFTNKSIFESVFEILNRSGDKKGKYVLKDKRYSLITQYWHGYQYQ